MKHSTAIITVLATLLLAACGALFASLHQYHRYQAQVSEHVYAIRIGRTHAGDVAVWFKAPGQDAPVGTQFLGFCPAENVL